MRLYNALAMIIACGVTTLLFYGFILFNADSMKFNYAEIYTKESVAELNSRAMMLERKNVKLERKIKQLDKQINIRTTMPSSGGIKQISSDLHPELPILTNVICDEGHDIDSIQSKLNASKSRSCLFSNYSLCYSFSQKHWIYFTDIDAFGYDIHGQLATLQLPLTLTDVIDLRFASMVKHNLLEPYEKWNQFNFTIVKKANHVQPNNTFLSTDWTTFGRPTMHGDNVAHVLWDTYYKIYKAADNFVYNGIIHSNISINVIFQQNTWPSNTDLLPKYRNTYEPILFNDVIYGLDELHDKYKNWSKICFENIVIGTNEYSGLINAIHTNNQLLKYIRRKILNHFNLNDAYKP
eukprot:3399_1